MKLKKHFLCTTLAILLNLTFSCSKDDDSNSSNDPNGPININLIEGEWKLKKEVEYYNGMSETYNAGCSTESRMIITSTEITAKEDDDCDGDYDYEDTISYTIGSYEGFEHVIMENGYPSAIIFTLTNSSLVIGGDYYVDPDTGEEEYFALFFERI